MFVHQNWINKSYTKLQHAINVCDDCFELTHKPHYIIPSLCGYTVMCGDNVPENAVYIVYHLTGSNGLGEG